VYDILWAPGVKYGHVHHNDEVEFSTFNFEQADVAAHLRWFDDYERESLRLIELDLVRPAYDFCLKCSHAFNVLDARGAISVAERQKYIGRVRKLARLCAQGWVKKREAMGHPLLAAAAEVAV